MGVPSVFVRTSGCNLRCAWCDTKYAYDKGIFVRIDRLAKVINSSSFFHINITGGEPLLFKKEIIINKAGYKIGILGLISEKSLSKELVSDLLIKDSIDSLKDAVSTLKKKVDLIILITYTNDKEFRTIIKNSKGIDIILSSGINEQLTSPVIENNSVTVRMLPSGDSIGNLKYTHKKDAQKVDLEYKDVLSSSEQNLEQIVSTFQNKIDFLGKAYDGKNTLDAKVKKYEALRKTSAPRI